MTDKQALWIAHGLWAIAWALIGAALLTGCASRPSIDELMAEASQCVLEYNENGIIKPAPKEHKDECWTEVNKRVDAEIRRAERRASANYCRSRGLIKYCDNHGCGCVTRESVRRAAGSRPY